MWGQVHKGLGGHTNLGQTHGGMDKQWERGEVDGHTEGGMDTLGEDTQVGTNIQGKRIPVVSDS